MWIRSLTVGIGIVASAFVGVHAQDRSPSRHATVDASGRVLPVSPAPTQAAGSDRAGGSAPCATDKTLSPEEARALVTRVATEEDFYPDFVLSVAKTESRFTRSRSRRRGPSG